MKKKAHNIRHKGRTYKEFSIYENQKKNRATHSAQKKKVKLLHHNVIIDKQSTKIYARMNE